MIPDTLPPPPAAALPEALAGRVAEGTALAHAAAAAWTHAPFLRGLLRGGGDTLARLAGDGPAPILADAHEYARNPDVPTPERLRRARGTVALTVALADIAQLWPLEPVVGALSAFADLALHQAIRAAIAERVPGAAPTGFVALALGKLGSHELNYSSDLDLIFLYDRAAVPRRPREEPEDAAVRIGRRVVELMQARDGHGYVARIDLRLRPSSEITPIALPIEAALSYYHSEALPWERAAFIRARACAGDVALGEQFLAEVAPFVWRRSLDFQAIAEVRAVSLRIRDHFDASQHLGPGFDLKRGRGGIREIEFFAQSHQMVFGGRDPGLRAPATLDALAALAAADRIDPAQADTLARAYRYLRAAEHRAQMVEDAQTHAIPEAVAARANYAQFSGYPDWPAMERDLADVTGAVAPIYQTIADVPAASTVPRDPALLARWLAERGLPESEDGVRLVGGWIAGNRRALRSAPARNGLEAVLPELLAAFATAVDARAPLIRFDRFLDQLAAGAGFFALLAANPPLVGLLGRMLSAAPALADALARRPELFDVLLDARAFAPLPDAAALTAELATQLGSARDAEDRLTRVRQWTGERRFQIGSQLVEGRVDPLDAASAYAALADAALTTLAATVEADYAAQHGRIPGANLIVLALGRYGGGRLTARSDLDLVYLHSGADDAVADGPRPVPASLYFHRLATRLTAALSVPTAAGTLYEIDTRLRPSGSKGPLVVSLSAFERYQREEAWTFEHMALTRARVVVAPSSDRAAVEAVIEAALRAPGDLAKLQADVLAMRGEMERHRPGGGLFDVKNGAGGLIDIEFIVQYLQLATGRHLTPRFRDALAAFAAEGLIAPSLPGAHALLTRTLIVDRLIYDATHGPLPEPSASAQALLARACGQGDAAELRARLEAAKAEVRAQWGVTFGTPREG